MNNQKALWLRAEGDYAILSIEVRKGVWVELIRETIDSPFSHIIEPLGIQRILLDQGKNDERSVATGDAQNDEAGNKKGLRDAANNLISVYENSKWIAPDEVNEAILELSKYILKK
jgi:hypothetical protein